MLYRYSDVFRTGLLLADLSAVALSWLAAYWMRFHSGMSSPLGTPPIELYLIPLAEDGLLAQAWAQTSTCKDSAPIGGIDATFSTNPVALAMPTGADPIIADFSSSSMALGKVGQMVLKGEKAPELIFMDSDGELSDEAVRGEG